MGKVRVTLPKFETFVFPCFCVVCLKPAEKFATARYAKIAESFGPILRIREYEIKVPYCNKHYKIAKLGDLINLLGILLSLLALILVFLPVPITFGLFISLLVVGLAFMIYGRWVYKPPGFSFKVGRDNIEFTFKNPKYAKIFMNANMMDSEWE